MIPRFRVYPLDSNSPLLLPIRIVCPAEKKQNIGQSSDFLDYLPPPPFMISFRCFRYKYFIYLLISFSCRLRKLETIIVHSDLLFESTLTFFTSQKHLEVIKLSLVDAKESNVKQLLFHVLKVCPNLRELWLNITPDRLSLNQVELSKLFQRSTRLECLSLNFHTTVVGASVSATAQNLLTSSVNKNLRTLQLLESDILDENTCIVILNHCRNLRHLELSKVTDKILQELFKTQV